MSHILGALSKLDEVFSEPTSSDCSVAVPETSRNNDSENWESTEIVLQAIIVPKGYSLPTTLRVKTIHAVRDASQNCNQFPSFLSVPYLSTRSMTCMHLEKFKVFSSLRQPETHFRHKQSHQFAGAITGFINVTQNTHIAVNGVEYHKRVNIEKKLETGYLVSGNNQTIISSLLAEKLERKTHKHCIAKAH